MSHFARIKQVLQAVREDRAAIGGEWSPADRIDLGPDAEPMEPDTWGEWADMPVRLAPEAPTVRSRPTRRGFLGGMLAVLGVGSGTVAATTSGPITAAYRRWLDCLDATTRWHASPANKLGLPYGPESDQSEQEFRNLDVAESKANIELVHRIVEASGVDPETVPTYLEYEVERHAVPFAVCREGGKVFALVLVDAGQMGAINIAESDAKYAVRPVVIEIEGGQS